MLCVQGRRGGSGQLGRVYHHCNQSPGRLSEFSGDTRIFETGCSYIPYFIDEIRATKEVPKVTGLKPGKRTYVPDSSSHHWLPGDSEKNSVPYHVKGFLDSDGSGGVARRSSRCAHIVSLVPALPLADSQSRAALCLLQGVSPSLAIQTCDRGIRNRGGSVRKHQWNWV